MQRIIEIVPGVSTADDAISLDHDRRTRRRMVHTTDGGSEILLDMPRTVHLRDGDGLILENGNVVRVEAAPEAVIDIRGADVAALVRIAWHLGNRHLPTQLLPGADGGSLRIRTDHVIVAMVEGLGGHCRAIDAPFDPEAGAYAAGEGGRAAHHHHDHDHAG
ncbi:hypothetical protein BH09PSE4_BH09PSE4_13400 [soil metagenome]